MAEPFDSSMAWWTGVLQALGPSLPQLAADRRFAGDAWQQDPRFAMLARSYLAQAELLDKTLLAAPLDERTRAQWRFLLRQVIDAASPGNCLATNPEAMQQAIDSGGASLATGLRLFFGLPSHRRAGLPLRVARGPHRAVDHGLCGCASARRAGTLGASGHIAGVINPLAKRKRNHWIAPTLPSDPQDWLAAAESAEGSWWPAWTAWLDEHAGARRPALRRAGNAKYSVIEPAPGRYVKAKAES
jgi:hypothetical protein